MSFTFSFSSADIDTSDPNLDSEQPIPSPPPPRPAHQSAFPNLSSPPSHLLPPTIHSLADLLATLPDRLAYTTLSIPLDDGLVLRLPRRELWDVRLQVMAEDEGDGEESDGVPSHYGKELTSNNAQSTDSKNAPTLSSPEATRPTRSNAANAALGAEDVKTGVYEGGFKSWESSTDLVRELAARRNRRRDDGRGEDHTDTTHVVLEMGCGTALPSLAVLQWALSDAQGITTLEENLSKPTTVDSSAETSSQPVTDTPASSSTSATASLQNLAISPLHLLLADYNPPVLRLVTVPNLLLTYAHALSQASQSPWTDDGEIEVTPALLNAFTSALVRARISIACLSGAWGSPFVDLIHRQYELATARSTQSNDGLPSRDNLDISPTQTAHLLVLAAETIYSPAALQAFATSLAAILSTSLKPSTSEDPASSSSPCTAEALVAAKKIYFGVGGSMADFVARLQDSGYVVARAVREEKEGVGREVVSVMSG